MPEKRKLPDRAKKQTTRKKSNLRIEYTPPTETQDSEQEEEELLPTRIKIDSPLPTVASGSNLGEQILQSIAESGVLAASLSRSHQVWLTENLFERFWAKPSKRKGWVEPPNNPSKDKMGRAGSCQIIIAPHILDATIYSIKQPNTSATSNPQPKNPILHYNPPAAVNTANQSQTTSTSQRVQPAQPQPVITAVPAPSPPTASPSQPSAPAVTSNQSPQSAKKPQTLTSEITVKSPAQNTTSQALPKQGNNDPVIQMLAQRASTNPELKLLMKIVASGGASSEQLKSFQNHIDELNAIIRREQEQAKKKPQPASLPQQTVSAIPQTPSMASQQSKFSSFQSQQPSFVTTPQPKTTIPKTTTPKPPKNEITGAVIEFNEPGASGDRYTFPRNSILEFSPSSRQVTASFLLVRKPNAASGPKYNPSEEYYQPVTMHIVSDTPKVLDVLAKAVAPVQEVTKYMEDIINEKKRAEHVQLALQLPVETEPMSVDESGRSTPIRSDSHQKRKYSTAKMPSVFQPPGVSSAKEKSDDKVNTWEDRHCQFCLKMVPSAATRENGKPMCQSCENLRRIDRIKHPFDYHREAQIDTSLESSSSGPQTLML